MIEGKQKEIINKFGLKSGPNAQPAFDFSVLDSLILEKSDGSS